VNWGDQSSSCVLSPPDGASLGSPSAASSFAFASDRFPCGAAGSPRPHRALCSASFFGSQCDGNGLIGSIGLWFTRPTLKYVLWSRKNCFQCSTLCQKEGQKQMRNRRQTRRDKPPKMWLLPPPQKSPPKFVLGEGGDYWVLTWISPSESPRRSCVRCSLKHPVPNARAASTPALIPHHNRIHKSV
jgi:hypothetical protein